MMEINVNPSLKDKVVVITGGAGFLGLVHAGAIRSSQS
jgi:NAD(P)-dependent dehydrogenase (short-subunit alcohol dehydrogenase family)